MSPDTPHSHSSTPSPHLPLPHHTPHPNPQVSLASGTTQSPGPATAGHLTPQQEAHVRVESLQCLVHVQESLLHWHADASGFLAAPASPKRREGSQGEEGWGARRGRTNTSGGGWSGRRWGWVGET